MADLIAIVATVVVVGLCAGYAIAPAVQEWKWNRDWRKRR